MQFIFISSATITFSLPQFQSSFRLYFLDDQTPHHKQASKQTSRETEEIRKTAISLLTTFPVAIFSFHFSFLLATFVYSKTLPTSTATWIDPYTHEMRRFTFKNSKSTGSSACNSSSSRGNKPRPRLDRRNAQKNIDYDAASSASSCSLDDSSSASGSVSDSRYLHTRSLDILEKTSFRIEGNDGEFDRICKSLGFLGIEDFAIPTDLWEARNRRSASDLLPRSRLSRLDSPKEEEQKKSEGSAGLGLTELTRGDSGGSRVIEDANAVDKREMRFRECVGCDASVTGSTRNESSLLENIEEENAVDNVGYDIRDRTELIKHKDTVEKVESTIRDSVGGKGRERSGNGIKGTRPPGLKPPPSMRLPPIDPSRSTWDLFKGFGPIEKEPSDAAFGGFSSCDEAEEGVNGMNLKDDKGLRLGETVLLSSSCSFTTSNDDDSSSSTTEPMSNISPNGRICWNTTNWEKGELLGRGSFGSVYEGIAEDGFFFAVKEVSLLDQGTMGKQSILQLEQEIALLSQFEHENIVRYYGTAKDDTKLYIFFELVTKGSLLNLYQRYHLRDSQVSAYTRQILHGLKYLHNRNVIHRDIKCANLLVHTNGSVKLADFGLAKATKLNDVKSCQGTAFWMAPEVVRAKNHGYGLPADIWSLGCTVLEMLTGQFPYAPLECMQALWRIGKGEPPPVPETLSNDARDFILNCIQVNPDDRPTATQLLNHPFVRRPLSGSLGSASPYHLGRRLTT